MTPEQVTVGIGGGHRLPIVGLGTWNVTGDDVAPAVRTAVECGCRHIDTAYGHDELALIDAMGQLADGATAVNCRP